MAEIPYTELELIQLNLPALDELCAWLNEKWKAEVWMRDLETSHPEAEADCYRRHEINMLRYEQLFQIVQQYKLDRCAYVIEQRTDGEWNKIGAPFSSVADAKKKLDNLRKTYQNQQFRIVPKYKQEGEK